jgi:hypothetical protein
MATSHLSISKSLLENDYQTQKLAASLFCESFSNADFIIFRLQIMLAGLSPVGRSVAKMQRHKT